MTLSFRKLVEDVKWKRLYENDYYENDSYENDSYVYEDDNYD